MALFVDLLVKERLLEVQAKCDSAHDIDMEFVARLVEVQHSLLKMRGVGLLWPLVPPPRIPVAANFHALLEVRSLCPEFRDFVRVSGLSNSLSSNGDISTIGARVFPGEFLLKRYHNQGKLAHHRECLRTFTSFGRLKNSPLYGIVH